MANELAKKHIGFKKKRMMENIFYACLVALPLLNFVVFFIGVNANSIMLSFKEYDINGSATFVGFKNFLDVFEDISSEYVVKVAMKNSAFIYLFNLVIQTPICLLISYFVYKGCPGSEFFKVMLFLPNIISGIVMATIFTYLCDRAIPEILINFGIQTSGLISDPDTAFMTILIYNTIIGFGGGMILYTGTMSGISESVVESCHLDGANMMQEFWYITLPMIYPMLTVGLITGVSGLLTADIGLFAYYGTGAPGKLYTMGYYIFAKTYSSTQMGYPYLSALGLILTVVAVPLTYTVKYFLEKYDPMNS